MQFSTKQIFWMAFASIALQGITSLAWSKVPIQPDHAWVMPFLSSLISYAQGLIMWVIGSQGTKDVGQPGNIFTPATTPKTVIALIVGAGVMLAMLPGSAHAAPKALAILQPAATPPAPKDLISKIEAVKKEVVDGIIADITAALADASAIDPDTNKPRDAIAAACYPEQIKFLQTLPVAAPLQGKFILVQLFQRKRDFVIQLQKGLPASLKIGCGALLGDEVSIAIKTLGMVGVSVTAPEILPMMPALGALPALPFGLTLP